MAKSNRKKRPLPCTPSPKPSTTKPKLASASTGRIDYSLLSPPDQAIEVSDEDQEDSPARNTRSKVTLSQFSSGSDVVFLSTSKKTCSPAPKKTYTQSQTHPTSYAKAVNPTTSSSSSSKGKSRQQISPSSSTSNTIASHHLIAYKATSSSTLASPQASHSHQHQEIEAECIICSEEISEILAKAEKEGKGGIGGGLGLWSCELAGCGALFCIECAIACIDRSTSKTPLAKPNCPACTREWNVEEIRNQAKAYDSSEYPASAPGQQQPHGSADTQPTANNASTNANSYKVNEDRRRSPLQRNPTGTPNSPGPTFTWNIPTIDNDPINHPSQAQMIPLVPADYNLAPMLPTSGPAVPPTSVDGFVQVGNGRMPNAATPSREASRGNGKGGVRGGSSRIVAGSNNRYVQ
ncbi:hypothetical protein V865_007607 [Kwoniella europaea PYCC6329]|uniref:RING-type domain-containing protein n=1 Tax=Kwoniella europaea PYCC6329 TaxID=1423913 RepID=A0AAX4KUQ1_9TREE